MVLRHTSQNPPPNLTGPSRLRDGCPQHTGQMVNGKPLKLIDHYKALREAGLITSPPQLDKATLDNNGFKPPGAPKTVSGKPVYPHFG